MRHLLLSFLACTADVRVHVGRMTAVGPHLRPSAGGKAQALADNGGAGAIRLVRYTPEPALAGKTLEEIMVSGEWVIDNGSPTGKHSGQVLLSPALRP